MKKLALVALVVGCSSSNSTSTAPHTGALTVTITTPGGIADSVKITGPGGYSEFIHSSTTLTGIAPGSYTITAASVVAADPIVATLYGATVVGSPAVVGVGTQASVTVTIASRTGSGALWVVGGSDTGANILNTAMAYTASQLRSSSSTSPTVKMDFPITTGHNIDASGVAFDAQGNLWVVNDNSNTVVEYTASQLATSGAATPAVTIQLAAMSVGYAIAFDSSGNLWVGNNLANTIVEFTASQLTASGSPTPAVTIAEVPASPGALQEPIGLAFDKHGNLWVANNATSTIVEYTRDQLGTSGNPAPAVTISGPAILEPNEIAFDSAGNLWVTNSAYYFKPDSTSPDAAGRIVEYAASSLTASGTPTPLVTLNLPMGTFTPLVTGIAFDDSGNLWFADVWNARIGEYTAAQLTAGGSPTPATLITSTTGVGGVGIAFNPHTAVLPLH